MARQRLIIEMSMGIDQHGQESTVAAARVYETRSLTMLYLVSGKYRSLSDPDR